MDENQLLREEKKLFFGYEGNLDFSLNKLTKVPGLMILMCVGGIGTVAVNYQEFTLSANSQLILLPRTTIELLQSSPGFRVRFILYPPEIMVELGSQIDHKLLGFIRHNPHYDHPADKSAMVRVLLDAMIEVYHDKENRFRKQMSLNLLLTFLLDMYDKVESFLARKEVAGVSTRQEDLFRRFISLLHEHCPQQREVCFYAGKLHITPRYLSIITRQIVGKAAKEIIDEYLIAEAKILLQSTGMAIKEITLELNFPDQSFFCKFFKKQTGTSPKEFREKDLRGALRAPEN